MIRLKLKNIRNRIILSMQSTNSNQNNTRMDAEEQPSTTLAVIINNSDLIEELKTDSDTIIATKPRACSLESPAIITPAAALAACNASADDKHSTILTGAELESTTTRSEEEFKTQEVEEGKQSGERHDIVIARIAKQFTDWRHI